MGKIPTTINALMTTSHIELIQDVAEHEAQWLGMAGKKEMTAFSTHPTSTTTARNPFAVLSEEEEHSS